MQIKIILKFQVVLKKASKNLIDLYKEVDYWEADYRVLNFENRTKFSWIMWNHKFATI